MDYEAIFTPMARIGVAQGGSGAAPPRPGLISFVYGLPDPTTVPTPDLLAATERERFGRLVFLLFQLAGAMVRLAITLPADEAEIMLVDFKQIIHGQLASFRPAETPKYGAQQSA